MASLGDGGSLAGSNKLPLPEKFNGKMEHWEDWSWQMKSYLSLFKTDVAEVMEQCETVATPITDERLEQLEASNPQFVDAGLIQFSRELHYFLTQLTVPEWW